MPRKLRLTLFVFTLLSLCAPAARARQGAADPQFERGVELYRKGDAGGAAREFRAVVKRTPDDPRAWAYLGRALIQSGDYKEARKALDSALRLNPDSAPAHSHLALLDMLSGREREAEPEAAKALALDNSLADAHYVLGLLRLRESVWLKALEEAEAVIKLDPAAAPAYSLKTQALLGLYERASAVIAEERRGTYDYDDATVREARASQPQRLKEAADSLAEYLRLKPDAADAAELREELEAIRFYADAASSDDPARKVYSTRDGIQRAEILSKPEPGYTEEARRANVSGVVRLRVVLGADGTVQHAFALRRLGYGLTEKAVEAAKRIRFRPATLGGQPVSQYVILEYGFNVGVRGIRLSGRPPDPPLPGWGRP